MSNRQRKECDPNGQHCLSAMSTNCRLIKFEQVDAMVSSHGVFYAEEHTFSDNIRSLLPDIVGL
jgi:hypothetical protein